MKEIIAIIRPSKMNATKKSLDELNIPSVTAAPVSGRGHQRGLNPILTGIEISKDALLKGHITGMKFVPKRMLIIVAKDEDVDVIVDAKDALLKGHITGMKFVPKRMLIIVAKDEDVDAIVDAIVKSNKTGYIGDGKIFICPTDNALRIRTNETGDVAL